jgi:hypothetical protein
VHAVGPTGARHLPLVAAGLLLGAPLALEAQEGCDLVSSEFVNVLTLPGIGRVTHIKRPHFACEGGVEIFADSAAAQGERGMSDLIGSVRYLESGRELLADRARYFTVEGRLQASGNMSIRDDVQGSSIRNGELVYLLATDFRSEEEMTITTGEDGVRPHATLSPPPRQPEPVDSAQRAAAAEATELRESADTTVLAEAPDTTGSRPYTVVSDRMFLRAGRYFTASGAVEIVRDSLFAFADSALYDQEGGALELEGSARVEGASYELVGRTITMGSPGSVATEVQAVRDARLVGDGFELNAARIRAFLVDDALERLVATPLRAAPEAETEADSTDLARAEAVVDQFELSADSLEILAPNEAIERVFAAGRARSESASGDTLNVDVLPEIARKDWLEGDTIVISFVVLEGTESRDVEVEEITALGDARSLYRLASTDSSAVPGTDAPAVHYVTGSEIRIEMADGEVAGMRVTGQTRGMHFEPLQRSTPRDTTALDTLGIPLDTLAAPLDSASAPPGRRAPSLPELHPQGGSSTTQLRPSPVRSLERPRLEERPWTRP